MGSVVAEVDDGSASDDGSVQVTATRSYDVYGGLRSSSGSGGNHKFCGQLGHTADADTGLIYMRARYYDPTIGRFISEDPSGNGSNWYAYANCNPVNLLDATGRYIFPVFSMAELVSQAWRYIETEGSRFAADQSRDLARSFLGTGTKYMEVARTDWEAGQVEGLLGSESVEGDRATVAGGGAFVAGMAALVQAQLCTTVANAIDLGIDLDLLL